jgi:uncharacterized OB-fold protein
VTTTDAPTAAPPRPVPDEDSAKYWQKLSEHRIFLQACTACDRRRFPATPACPYCAHPTWRLEEVPGTGIVYSFIVVHRAFDPAFAAEVPYTVATVDLDGGGRVVARMGTTPAIGARVSPDFVDHLDWTELRFRDLEAS